MKSKIKKFINSKLFVFIITALVFSTIGVSAATYFESSAVTYDNTESGLESTDVQGAIDELYSACKNPPLPPGGDGILESVKIVTSGDGLYKDEYETEYNDKYVYKGKNPNNYIYFNNELWRIISIEGNRTIKIIRNETIGSKRWSNGIDDWREPSTLNTYLNETYYNTLNSDAKSHIVVGEYSLGEVTWDSSDLSNTIYEENVNKWSGKIALVTISEYIRANSYKSRCGSLYSFNSYSNVCNQTNWMYKSNLKWWTLTPKSYGDQDVYYIEDIGAFVEDPYTSHSIIPVLYLSSDTQITGGTGTQSDPYRIE